VFEIGFNEADSVVSAVLGGPLGKCDGCTSRKCMCREGMLAAAVRVNRVACVEAERSKTLSMETDLPQI
jgi:hypothetical protein